jgi:hypothetical protein
MRIVAVIVEVAASRLTKIPISDQVCFLSNRLTAQSGPREPIVSKNRAGRERINLWRQDRSASTGIDPREAGYFIGGVSADGTRKFTLRDQVANFFEDRARQPIRKPSSRASGKPVKREVRKPWRRGMEPSYMTRR